MIMLYILLIYSINLVTGIRVETHLLFSETPTIERGEAEVNSLRQGEQ